MKTVVDDVIFNQNVVCPHGIRVIGEGLKCVDMRASQHFIAMKVMDKVVTDNMTRTQKADRVIVTGNIRTGFGVGVKTLGDFVIFDDPVVPLDIDMLTGNTPHDIALKQNVQIVINIGWMIPGEIGMDGSSTGLFIRIEVMEEVIHHFDIPGVLNPNSHIIVRHVGVDIGDFKVFNADIAENFGG